jgi:hypothetical protein
MKTAMLGLVGLAAATLCSCTTDPAYNTITQWVVGLAAQPQAVRLERQLRRRCSALAVPLVRSSVAALALVWVWLRQLCRLHINSQPPHGGPCHLRRSSSLPRRHLRLARMGSISIKGKAMIKILAAAAFAAFLAFPGITAAQYYTYPSGGYRPYTPEQQRYHRPHSGVNCSELRAACIHKEELGERGEGNCARYRELCRR